MSQPTNNLKIALLGCGQIADAHLSQIARIDNAEVVAVCDVYEDLSYQAAARFNVPKTFTDLDRMISEVKPDVVHITTPAHTHANLSIKLLSAGCHVYVEKPFTLDVTESASVLAAAELANRSICVGHDQLFDPMWIRCRDWIKRGLIGKIGHIELILGYPIEGNFGALVAANPNHSVRKLPGGLFQNTISHPLYRITDFMDEDQPKIIGGWYTQPEYDFPTEMQLSFQGRTQSASLTFSTHIPPQRITRIYGSKGSLDIDFDTQTVRLNKLAKLPGALAKLEVPWQHLRNASWNFANNCWRFAKSDIHYFAGMKGLFEAL
jgi:predicted dehydrogenase